MNIQEVTSMLADHFPKFKVTVIEKMQVGMTRWAQEGPVCDPILWCGRLRQTKTQALVIFSSLNDTIIKVH